MRPILAVGKIGIAPGELCVPNAVAIDRNTNHIYFQRGIYSITYLHILRWR